MARQELRALEVEDDDSIIDRTLRQTLEPLLGLPKGRDIIVFKEAFTSLSDKRKVVAYHLGRLALKRLRGDGVQVEATTETVAAETQVPEKSCIEYHSRLKKQKMLDKNDKGWLLPLYSVTRAASFVAGPKKRG